MRTAKTLIRLGGWFCHVAAQMLQSLCSLDNSDLIGVLIRHIATSAGWVFSNRHMPEDAIKYEIMQN